MLGKTMNVLVEDSREGENRQLAGFTGNYLRVLLDCTDSAINRILPVKLLALDSEFIQGELALSEHSKVGLYRSSDRLPIRFKTH